MFYIKKSLCLSYIPLPLYFVNGQCHVSDNVSGHSPLNN